MRHHSSIDIFSISNHYHGLLSRENVMFAFVVTYASIWFVIGLTLFITGRVMEYIHNSNRVAFPAYVLSALSAIITALHFIAMSLCYHSRRIV